MSSIKFILGEETNPKIEGWKEYLDQDYPSIFKDQYDKAFDSIKKYTVAVNKNDDNDCVNNGKILPLSLEYPNNVFAFIGERGSGKTSCMMSVEAMLQKKDKEFKNKRTELIGDDRFVSIELIDPSFFDDKCNIMEIIIGKMFKQFKKEIEENQQQISDEIKCKKNLLIEKFQQVKTDLNAMQKRSDFTDDSLEQLMELAAGVDLKKSLQDLIRSYLSFFSGEKDSFLIIPIDDIDLHTRFAHTMVEQIRKYFVLPEVIILMAVKVDQLALVVKNKFTEEFKNLLDKREIEFAVIDEMVDRYLGKLIPLEHRIYLPDMATSFERELLIYKNEEDNSPTEYSTLRTAVTSLIFQKTRFLFYHFNGNTSYIVPRNLRELRNLIFQLISMANFRIQKRPEYNKLAFKKYFFETWTANNLDSSGAKIAEELINITDAATFNKTVLSKLKQKYNNIVVDILAIKPQVELSYILSNATVSYNISLGDINAFINQIDSISPNIEDKKLLFFIRSLYSMKMYQYYDEITESNSITNNKELIYIEDENLVGISNYYKLIAGNFINSKIVELLPDEKGKRNRSNRQIDFRIIKAIASQYKDNTRDDISYEKITINKEIGLQIMEFFAITSSKKYNSKDSSYENSYRNYKSVYYNEDLTNQENNVFFDLASIFYNITNIEIAYNRFNKDLFSWAKDSANNSILKMLFVELENKEGKQEFNVKNDRLLSWVSIRNSEILNHFEKYIEHDKTKGSIGGGNLAVLRYFFRRVSNYKVKTYDRDDNGLPYIISFNFFSIFDDVLKGFDSDFFELIYSPTKKTEFNINNIALYDLRNNAGHTIIKKIFDSYPQLQDDMDLRSIVEKQFSKYSYSKDEAIQNLTELKLKLDGQSSGSN